MEIKALNSNCFYLRGKGAILLLGVNRKKAEADVVVGFDRLKSGKLAAKKRKEPFLIPGPGEYEISGIEIGGGAEGLWLIQMEGFKIGYLADGWRKIGEKKIDSLGSIDLLFLSLDQTKEKAQKAAELVKKISPLLVIVSEPEAKNFLDCLDQEDLQPEDKLVIKPVDLPEETKVMVLRVRQ